MKKILVKVAAYSSPSKVAGAIAGMIRSGDEVCIRTVGLSSMIRAIYALSLATEFLAEENIEATSSVSSVEIDMGEGKEFTGFEFDIYVRDLISKFP